MLNLVNRIDDLVYVIIYNNAISFYCIILEAILVEISSELALSIFY